jgi:lipopolysaccharide transport system ATP-binding protein
MSILRLNNLGKAYKQYPNHWSRLVEWCLPGERPLHHLYWALQNINFHVSAGETIGIVGMNGAGKSTLLKIIAGTTQLTTGSMEIAGRVSALLELGMGFHPEFTGRQNVVMAGQLFGFPVDEIQSLLPEIEVFAEIGEYIDQPVRTYSSGMQMRLAFAVATAKRPDILIIDEALSVGDSYFQHKSFRRIRTFRDEGTTLLLVSHDPAAIQSICDRVIVLHEGKIVKEGHPDDAMDFYHALLSTRDTNLIRQERQAYGKVQTISGCGDVSTVEINLLTEEKKPIEAVETGTPVILEIRARVNTPVPEMVMGFLIKDRFGQVMYGINSYRLGMTIEHLSAGDQVIGLFQFNMNLGKGNYSISTSISRKESHLADNYEWRDGGFVFSVLNRKKPDFVGSASLDATLTIQRSSPEHVISPK